MFNWADWRIAACLEVIRVGWMECVDKTAGLEDGDDDGGMEEASRQWLFNKAGEGVLGCEVLYCVYDYLTNLSRRLASVMCNSFPAATTLSRSVHDAG